ncbi:MAG: adenine phosphoribosyltransferase [Clostridia bacterium]|nr:adenine phosphoribosyltransferase [Clostridia bacterium]
MKELKDYIRTIPNFPKEGIMFRDVTTVFQDAEGLQLAINSIQESLSNLDFDVIVAPESRGFLFGIPIAYNMKKSFVPVRKKGKLPYETIEESYDLEYGTETLEIHKDSISKGTKVVIIDDLIATGGTIEAIIKLVERLGGEVIKISCLIELPTLKGREKIKDYEISSSVIFDGE